MKLPIFVSRPGVLLLKAFVFATCLFPNLVRSDHTTGAPATAGTNAAASAARAGAPDGYPALYERVEALRANAIKSEPLDEAMAGKTFKGTPVTPRIPECFPAESRDLFWQMDMVSPGTNAPLQPLNFDLNRDGVIDDTERNAVRGRNTWLLWGGGNETFWNWLAQDGFGITDFLILLDSRSRSNRFARAGLINQPGFRINSDPARRILGLYLDQPVEPGTRNSDNPEGYVSRGHVLSPPPWDAGAKRAERPADHAKFELFEPGDKALYRDTYTRLSAMGDGVDYSVYGFPSGIFGLRLFLNPDFFGTGRDAEKARAYWKERVEDTHDRYYTDPAIHKDPRLVRPFRVSVSCGFCHVGPHPLNPPRDPEAPDWANLSGTIGDQYWKPQPAFANLTDGNSFLYHFLASQQPGTVDTSLVSSDQINNANTINGVFEINARLGRAALNPPELQSAANVLVPSIEDPSLPVKHDGTDWRHTPRVLLDGSDSIGAFGALARVYLNIGTYFEEWSTCHNPIIGFTKQRPFRLEVCQRNSVYWQVNEKYRTAYLAAFFTHRYQATTPPPPPPPGTNTPAAVPHSTTQPMKLLAAKETDGRTPSRAALGAIGLNDAAQRRHGREVWLKNCAICHSSKQPEGFGLSFERKAAGDSWERQPAPRGTNYVLPMDAADWLAFRRSPAYADYINRLFALVGDLSDDPADGAHPFWKDNYLSTDIRVPVTLAGTQCGRAMASNGLEDNVWDNFSSITYKQLPAVGSIGYINPISGEATSFVAPGGGRGYYRPATHVSLWATAPFLHNNSLGVFTGNPSVKGRVVEFTDAMRRMLWSAKRPSRSLVLSDDELKWLNQVQAAEGLTNGMPGYIDPAMVVARPGDLRGTGSGAASRDVGFIYRVPQDTYVEFAPGFVRPLVSGVVGPRLTSILSRWLWVALFLGFAWLAWKHRPRYLGIILLALAVVVAGLLALSGLGGGGSLAGVLVMGASQLLALSSPQWWILAGSLALFGFIFIQAKADCKRTARILLALLLVGITFAVSRLPGSIWPALVTGVVAALVGWKWKPTLPGFSRAFFALLAVLAAGLGWAADCFVNGRAILTVPVANITIGPLPVRTGPIPRGTPVNLIMNLDPESPRAPKAVVSLVLAMAEIKKQRLVGEAAWRVLEAKAGQALLDASKCPDFVMDRGHLFGETLDPDPQENERAKESLIAFLKTL